MSLENTPHDDSVPHLVETQRAYDMIHRDATAHIAHMKNTQWQVTYYSLLLQGALFFFTTILPLGGCAKVAAITVLSVSIFVIWIFVNCDIISSICGKRKRLLRLYESFDPLARAVYGDIDTDMASFWKDWRVNVPLFLISAITALVVCVNAGSGFFVQPHS
jgi:hypothetical protein